MCIIGLGRMLRCLYRTLGVLLNNLYCIPTYIVWCVLLHPIYLCNPELYWRMEGQLFQWLLTMVAYWSYSAGYYIVETGDVIDGLISDETLVLVNHQSTSDVPLLMYAFSARSGLLEKLNWIMDAVFQYTNFGIVSTLHGDFFINAGRERRDASLKDLESYLKNKFLPRKRKWLVLFPEGGFLRKRKEASKRYAIKMHLPNLEYVTLPRMGALQTIINTLAPATMKEAESAATFASGDTAGSGSVRGEGKDSGKLKYIIDMTIAYPHNRPLDLGNVITGGRRPCHVRMHYKVYPICDTPFDDSDSMQSWLYNLYIEKNNMLGHYYKTGVWDPKFAKLDVNRGVNRELNQNEKSAKSNNKSKPKPGSDVVDEAPRLPPMIMADHNYTSTAPSPLPILNSSSPQKNNKLVHEVEDLEEDDDPCIYDPMSEEEAKLLASRDRTLHLDLLRIAVLHLFFISSTALHITALRMVYQIWP